MADVEAPEAYGNDPEAKVPSCDALSELVLLEECSPRRAIRLMRDDRGGDASYNKQLACADESKRDDGSGVLTLRAFANLWFSRTLRRELSL